MRFDEIFWRKQQAQLMIRCTECKLTCSEMTHDYSYKVFSDILVTNDKAKTKMTIKLKLNTAKLISLKTSHNEN